MRIRLESRKTGICGVAMLLLGGGVINLAPAQEWFGQALAVGGVFVCGLYRVRCGEQASAKSEPVLVAVDVKERM